MEEDRMGTHALHFEDGVLEFNQDVEWITSDLPEPDPNWKGADSNGHEHHAVVEAEHVTYPTLKLAAGEPYWCPDCRDEHTDTWSDRGPARRHGRAVVAARADRFARRRPQGQRPPGAQDAHRSPAGRAVPVRHRRGDL